MSAIGKQDDDVYGQIIGGDYGQAWVTYCGRRQGPMCYPRDEAEASAKCDALVAKIKEECGAAFKDIYPLQKWMYHFDGV